MNLNFNISIPFSLTEIFDYQAHQRASKLRAEAVETFESRRLGYQFVCTPQKHIFNKVPLHFSIESAEGHNFVMRYLAQIKDCVHV